MDRFREFFVLLVSSLSCYELGRNFQQKLLRLKDMYPKDGTGQAIANEGRGILSAVNRHISSLVSDNLPSRAQNNDHDDNNCIAEVMEEIVKIEHMILSLSDRITKLEGGNHGTR